MLMTKVNLNTDFTINEIPCYFANGQLFVNEVGMIANTGDRLNVTIDGSDVTILVRSYTATRANIGVDGGHFAI